MRHICNCSIRSTRLHLISFIIFSLLLLFASVRRLSRRTFVSLILSTFRASRHRVLLCTRPLIRFLVRRLCFLFAWLARPARCSSCFRQRIPFRSAHVFFFFLFILRALVRQSNALGSKPKIWLIKSKRKNQIKLYFLSKCVCVCVWFTWFERHVRGKAKQWRRSVISVDQTMKATDLWMQRTNSNLIKSQKQGHFEEGGGRWWRDRIEIIHFQCSLIL